MSMNDNLAREKWNELVQPLEEPKQQPIHKPQPKSDPKQGLTGIEKFIIFVFAAVLFGLLIANISVAMSMSTVNHDVQRTNAIIEQTQVENANLEQQVQELSRYDRIYDIAEDHDLELRESNIRNVGQ